MPEPLPTALDQVRALLLDPDRLVRAVAAGRRRGAIPAWRKVELRPVDLRAGRRLQVARYDERQAFTRNLGYGAEAGAEVEALLREPFGSWHVDAVDVTMQLRVTKRGEAQVHRATPERLPVARLEHDRAKPRLLDLGDPYLAAVGITTAEGRVRSSRRNKYHQVEEFLRALDAVLDPALLPRRPVRVVDLGAGNAYLTFAAHRFLTAYRGLPVDLVGVDTREAARERNTRLARGLGWDDVRFVAGTILDADLEPADVVLALHACDTATDEALARAVRWRSPLVLAAPCCHHDVQVQLRAARPPDPYGVLTRHALLRERFADVLTDALRAAVLRIAGYRVEVVDFVPTEHTPRNLLLRAVRTGAPPGDEVVRDYRDLVAQWGVRPRLAELLDDELSGALAG